MNSDTTYQKENEGKSIETDVTDVNNIRKCYEGNSNHKNRPVMTANLQILYNGFQSK